MIAQSRPDYSTTTRDIFGLLFRHKFKVVLCFVLSVSAALAIIFFYPRKYKSETKLLVRLGRETVTLDPTATTGQIIPVAVSRETEVNSVLEMLRSRIMIEKLVDQLGPEEVLRPKTAAIASAAEITDAEPATAQFSLVSWMNPDPVSDREKAIRRVGETLDFGIEKKSDVISVASTADSPEVAQRLVANLIDIYLGEHARVHRSAGSQAFFTEQTVLLRKSLADALDKLRDAKNSLGIVAVDNQRIILQREIINVECNLAETTASLAAARNKTSSLRTGFAGLPERLATDEIRGFPNIAADSMRQDLYHLEIREAELASRFTDQFPSLVAVREQIRAAKDPLLKEDKRRTQSTTTVNTVHNQIHLNLLTESSNVASLAAQTSELSQQLTQLRQRVRSLNDNEPQIDKLEQEVALCKANYATYCEKSEQSRIDNALQNERFTNVNVIQPASLVMSPVSPHKAKVLLIGILGGLLLGIGAAILSEHLDPSLKTTADVEDRLALPVLMAIPRVAQRHTVLT